jgi:hypothetical protein
VAKNIYNVGKTNWKMWNKLAQKAFNKNYRFFLENKQLFIHPKADISQEHWATTAWNVAWFLADAVQGATNG